MQLEYNLFLVWNLEGRMCSYLQLLWGAFSLGFSHYQCLKL